MLNTGIMKTTLDIPENELKDAIRFTGAHTKKAAVVEALRDFNRRQRMLELTGKLGTFEGFLSPEELAHKRDQETVL
jgi:Arc/MetJ family transcription regulator